MNEQVTLITGTRKGIGKFLVEEVSSTESEPKKEKKKTPKTKVEDKDSE